jgi:hypothetical protein
MFIHCMEKYMALSFHWNKKGENCYKFSFPIVMTLLEIKFLKFENS